MLGTRVYAGPRHSSYRCTPEALYPSPLVCLGPRCPRSGTPENCGMPGSLVYPGYPEFCRLLGVGASPAAPIPSIARGTTGTGGLADLRRHLFERGECVCELHRLNASHRGRHTSKRAKDQVESFCNLGRPHCGSSRCFPRRIRIHVPWLRAWMSPNLGFNMFFLVSLSC